jgi:hypothetical protein
MKEKRKVTHVESKWKGVEKMDFTSKRGFGINEIIGIAAGVIIAAVVVIPGLRTFAQTIMGELTSWWTGVSSSLFS